MTWSNSGTTSSRSTRLFPHGAEFPSSGSRPGGLLERLAEAVVELELAILVVRRPEAKQSVLDEHCRAIGRDPKEIQRGATETGEGGVKKFKLTIPTTCM
mgnify:CR=1 FL=1